LSRRYSDVATAASDRYETEKNASETRLPKRRLHFTEERALHGASSAALFFDEDESGPPN
jgi:hypothetical protein